MTIRTVGPLTTPAASGGAGAATSNYTTVMPIEGYVMGVHVKYEDSPPVTTDVTVATAGVAPAHPAMTILSLANENTDGWRYEGVERIGSDQDFSKMHRGFCQWFVKTIKLAKTEEPSSYGHAAKVLDLALKVDVYYCNMPRPAKAESLIPMLNGAIDTPLPRHLAKKLEDIYGKSYSRLLWSIEMMDKEYYDLLQKVIRQDIRDSFHDDILPVQYDDIMWRRLSR